MISSLLSWTFRYFVYHYVVLRDDDGVVTKPGNALENQHIVPNCVSDSQTKTDVGTTQ